MILYVFLAPNTPTDMNFWQLLFRDFNTIMPSDLDLLNVSRSPFCTLTTHSWLNWFGVFLGEGRGGGTYA